MDTGQDTPELNNVEYSIDRLVRWWVKERRADLPMFVQDLANVTCRKIHVTISATPGPRVPEVVNVQIGIKETQVGRER